MKKTIKYATSIAIIIFVFNITVMRLNAQSGFVVSGGDAYNTSGMVSYSVGQVNYTHNAGEDGSITAGLQQAYHIEVINGAQIQNIELDIKVFPNPASEYAYIKVFDADIENMSYHLYDLYGKILKQGSLTGDLKTISVHSLKNGSYILEIRKKNERIKVFKIIKN